MHTRTTNRNNRLVKEADFRYSATLEQLQAGSHRGVDGTIIKLVAKISRVDLLIIDNFGMKTLEGQQQNDFMEIIEDRHGRKATIIASQLPIYKIKPCKSKTLGGYDQNRWVGITEICSSFSFQSKGLLRFLKGQDEQLLRSLT